MIAWIEFTGKQNSAQYKPRRKSPRSQYYVLSLSFDTQIKCDSPVIFLFAQWMFGACYVAAKWFPLPSAQLYCGWKTTVLRLTPLKPSSVHDDIQMHSSAMWNWQYGYIHRISSNIKVSMELNKLNKIGFTLVNLGESVNETQHRKAERK